MIHAQKAEAEAQAEAQANAGVLNPMRYTPCDNCGHDLANSAGNDENDWCVMLSSDVRPWPVSDWDEREEIGPDNTNPLPENKIFCGLKCLAAWAQQYLD